MSENSFTKSRIVSKRLVLAGLIFTLLVIAIALAPGSYARRQAQTPAASQTGPAIVQKRRRPEFVPGDVLVRFKSGRAFEGAVNVAAPDSDVSPQIPNSGRPGLALPQGEIPVTVERFDGSNLVEGLRLAHVAPEDTLRAVAALKARDDVLYAEPNYLLYADDKVPNDPRFLSNELYGLTKIGAPQAWDTTIGSKNIVVGVVDQGIDTNHEDLKANIWTNPAEIAGNGIDDDGNGFVDDVNGYNFFDNNATVFSGSASEFHATHVAGTIGAVGNNGVGVVGVNWQVSLMSLKFLGPDGGSSADAIRAYNYAKQMRDLWTASNGIRGANIRVLNNSYGGGGYAQAAADAINALGQAGILFVAAAGNDARDADVAPNYPANYSLPNVISVAAADSLDRLAGFSNYGPHTVTMGAPGSSILSTTPNNTYSVFSGTSMATPHVTGAAALLCAANSNLTVNQLRALLSFNGDVTTALQGLSLTGRRLNVFKSLQAVINENDTTPPGTVTGFQVTSQYGRTVNLTWTTSGDDGAAGQASLYDISFIDQSTGAVIPLTTLAPAPSGATQNVSVNIPFRHTAGTIRLREFDNVGNEGTPATLQVNLNPILAEPYTTTVSSPAALSTGGTALGLTFDDRYKEDYALPFAFPFFGQNYNTVTISTNGNLYFSPPPKRVNGDADDVPSSIADLSQFKMIAGMWDDLDLRQCFRSDADVYVVTSPGRIIFRWQGVPFLSSTCPATPLTDPNSFINFEVELNSDGTIRTRYGAGNINLQPVVGISGGGPDPYVIDALTSELSPKSLTNAQGAVFTLKPAPLVQFSAASYSVNEDKARIDITVNRSVDIASAALVKVVTNDATGLQNCDVVNFKASPRCDYINTVTTLQFAAGEASKSFSIAIVDDSYAEGDETFTLSLVEPLGVALGPQSTASVTIIDNDGSTNGPNPIDNTNFFVRQQYIDFLGREPDPPGFNAWVNEINNCTGDTTLCDRIHVSQLFFQSAEFQQRGYFVYRFYPVSFGRKPFYVEFVPDLASVSGFLSDAQLEAAKAQFAVDFTARPAFASAYNGLNNTQYVDTLLSTAGVSSTFAAATRQALIDGLNSSTLTRAQVLRQIVESTDVSNKYFNQAYAVMEYFGYLRREPDALYLDWIHSLDTGTQPRTMVIGFVNSIEYRQRFGPP